MRRENLAGIRFPASSGPGMIVGKLVTTGKSIVIRFQTNVYSFQGPFQRSYSRDDSKQYFKCHRQTLDFTVS